jgi:hypothetical protein
MRNAPGLFLFFMASLLSISCASSGVSPRGSAAAGSPAPPPAALAHVAAPASGRVQGKEFAVRAALVKPGSPSTMVKVFDTLVTCADANKGVFPDGTVFVDFPVTMEQGETVDAADVRFNKLRDNYPDYATGSAGKVVGRRTAQPGGTAEFEIDVKSEDGQHSISGLIRAEVCPAKD